MPATGGAKKRRRAAFVDGYFRTGDLAVRSPDGYYTLRGRKSDLIISAASTSIRARSRSFCWSRPEVAEAAVVGVSDRLRGEVPVAYLVPAPIDAEGLEQRCRAKLASFKVPRGLSSWRSCPAPRSARSRSICCQDERIKLQLYEHGQASYEAYDPRYADVAALLTQAIEREIPA